LSSIHEHAGIYTCVWAAAMAASARRGRIFRNGERVFAGICV
jgi:hypothetical protein